MLFIHDHTFLVLNGTHYTTGSLNQQVMDRYKKWFGSVGVFATTRPIREADKAFIKPENKVVGPDFHLMPKSGNPFKLLSVAKPMEEAVRSSDCLVVRMSIYGAMGVHFARKHGVPYLVEMVACPWDSLWYHSIKGKILAPVMTLITKTVCKKAGWVLYVTNEFLQRRYPTKGRSTGCSDVELQTLDREALVHRIETIRTKATDEPVKLLTVARVDVKYKGQSLIIKALKKLREDGINCTYTLVGGGDPTSLLNLAKDEGVGSSVHFAGPVPHSEVFAFFDDADLYVQPSLQEGLPRAVVEAMSRACPVVGSTAGGIPELIASDCTFNKGDLSGFVRIIKHVDRAFLEKQAQANYEKASEYAKPYLDRKRNDFYSAFAKAVREGAR